MKMIFGQVVAVAVLSLVLVGLYFYKTRQAAAAEPIVPTIGAVVKPEAGVKVDKQDMGLQQGAQPPVAVRVQGTVVPRKPQHHCFLWRLFHRHQKPHPTPVIVPQGRPMPVSTVSCVTVCEPVWFCEPGWLVQPGFAFVP